ncbi:hypothetical protein MNEG_11065, partial [Monoraphidium neglectum]
VAAAPSTAPLVTKAIPGPSGKMALQSPLPKPSPKPLPAPAAKPALSRVSA